MAESANARSTVQRIATSIRVELSRLRKRIELNKPNFSYLEFKAHCQVIILLCRRVYRYFTPKHPTSTSQIKGKTVVWGECFRIEANWRLGARQKSGIQWKIRRDSTKWLKAGHVQSGKKTVWLKNSSIMQRVALMTLSVFLPQPGISLCHLRHPPHSTCRYKAAMAMPWENTVKSGCASPVY